MASDRCNLFYPDESEGEGWRWSRSRSAVKRQTKKRWAGQGRTGRNAHAHAQLMLVCLCACACAWPRSCWVPCDLLLLLLLLRLPHAAVRVYIGLPLALPGGLQESVQGACAGPSSGSPGEGSVLIATRQRLAES
jgi:hypothetical protein